MQKKSQKKKNPARKPNPFPFSDKKTGKLVAFPKGYKPKRRRKNPEWMKEPYNVAKFGLLALMGLVVTRQLPQFLLKSKNAGWLGYLSNLATASAAGLTTGRFVGKQAGMAVGVGGGLYMVNRFLTEQLSPIGNVLSLAGVGDAAASGSLGRIKEAYFPVPVIKDKDGKPVIPKEIDAASLRVYVDDKLAQGRRPAVAAGATTRPSTQVSGVSPRMQGKFAA